MRAYPMDRIETDGRLSTQTVLRPCQSELLERKCTRNESEEERNRIANVEVPGALSEWDLCR